MRKFLTLVCAFVMIASFSFAQQASADIYGTVVLEDGSKIPGVAVTLTGDVIGKRTTVTSAEGNFRFVTLPPGQNYLLTYELDGFKTVLQKGIRLYANKDITVTCTMETTTIKEQIEVTGKSPIVDVRQTKVGRSIPKEQLQSLPSSRNPWSVMTMVPGMMIDRVDVGGNEGGQQSNYVGNGVEDADSGWTIDGVDITDFAATGSSPSYVNVNSYEEMQVNVGANDIESFTGGVQLNFVTKRAGNRYSGDFHLHVTDKSWEAQNRNLPDSFTERGWVDSGINRILQYGINFGGPIKDDMLWFYGSYAIQDLHVRTITDIERTYWFISGYAKLNAQIGGTSVELAFSDDDKKAWNRFVYGPESHEPSSMWNQYGPNYNFRVFAQHVTGNLMISARGSIYDGGFNLVPTAYELGGATTGNSNIIDVQYVWLNPITFCEGSIWWYGINRDKKNIDVNANYYAENVIGGDHEIKFGFAYESAVQETYSRTPLNCLVYDTGTRGIDQQFDGGGEYIYFFPDTWQKSNYKRTSFFFQDTATFGKLTANLGLRYDIQKGSWPTVEQNSTMWIDGETIIFQDLMPAFTVPAGDGDGQYKVFSPRLSLSYDITGDGKNVAKLSVARYGTHAGTNLAFQNPGAIRYVGMYHAGDLNQNGQFDFEDLDFMFSSGFNPDDPTATTSYDRVSDDFNSPLVDELILSYEKAITDDISVSLQGTYKKSHKIVGRKGILSFNGDTPVLDGFDNWFQYDTVDFSDYVGSNGSTAPVWDYNDVPIANYRYNTKAYQTFYSLALVFQKRFSSKWMLDGSFVFMDWKFHLDPNDFFDVLYRGNGTWSNYYALNNFDFFDGGVVAPESGASGMTGVFVNSRWMFKLAGLVQLPLDINLSGIVLYQEGYCLPSSVDGDTGHGTVEIFEGNKKLGDDRLPNIFKLDLGLEKNFKLSDTAIATIIVNCANVTNSMTAQKLNESFGSRFHEVTKIMNPRVFMIGFRVNF